MHGPKKMLAQLFLMTPWLALSSVAEPVVYDITTPNLANHQLRIEAEFPAEAFGQGAPVLALPVWTPGSYKVRDYSKSISGVEILSPAGARLEKTAKNRWTVVGDLPPGEPVKVAYSVYGHELTVRTNFFSPDLSLIVGAATFLAPAPLSGTRLEGTDFEVRFPGLTSSVASGLEKLPSGAYLAHGYDELVDSPLLFGDLDEHGFTAGGKPHTLVQAGDRRYWNLPVSLRDAAKVVSTVQDFWGTIPYKDYHILNLITETRGGLEHLDSTVLMTSRFATSDREKYVEWLALVCHEHFHAWNVKRLRPKALGPFDYEAEVLTPSLWVAEGVTSYYDDLLVRRSGLSTRAEYLKALSGQLNTLWNTPGRQSLPLTEASLDAWIRLYQPTDNSINDDVSYYNKGAVVGWLLDTELRRRTQGKLTLDHVMREAYKQFARDGFEEAQFRALVSRMAGSSFEEFFNLALDGTGELELQSALDYWGLDWVLDDSKAKVDPFLGLNSNDGRTVDSVAAGSPAALAGLSPGDELLAIDGTRVPVAGPGALLKHLKVGKPYPVLVSRMGRLKELTVSLTAPPAPKRLLKVRTGEGAQAARLEAWLGPETTASAKASPERSR